MEFLKQLIFGKSQDSNKSEDSIPNYANYELEEGTYGSIGSCEAGQKLDKIILCMMDAGDMTTLEANRFRSFCQKSLSYVKRFHKSIPSDLKSDVFKLIRIELLAKANDLLDKHNITLEHPLEHHLRSYIITLTNVYFLPTPGIKRMTFEDIKENYSIENLFLNKHLKNNPELQESHILSIIRNSKNSEATKHDEKLFNLINATRNETLINAFSSIYSMNN